MKTRYHTLDALRFIAFIKVFLLHLPESVDMPAYNFLKQGGGTGVAIFFVLSGFLISDILLSQKERLGQVYANSFFMRRVFRIWPLYYLGVAIAYVGIYFSAKFGLSQSSGYMPNPLFSLTFLENYKMIWEGTHPQGLPLQVFWSLCIEEHFYLLWLLIFAVIKPKNYSITFVIIWGVGILSRYIFINNIPQFQINGGEVLSSLDYFAAGGLVAMIKRNSSFLLGYFVKTSIAILVLSFLIFQHVFYDILGIWAISITAFVYGLGILIFVVPGATKFRINERSFFSYLGKISYGLYVFHTPIIMVLIKGSQKYNFEYSSGINTLLFAITALVISILISHLSFKFYEGYFLKLREQYFKSKT